MDKTAPYRLWRRCLELSERENWEPNVEEAFGRAAGLPWEQWWEACRPLFGEPERLLLQVVDDPDDDFVWIGDGSDVLIVVNLLESKDKLMAAFEKMLKERHGGTRGRPKLDDYAVWPLDGPVNVRAIKIALDVWERRRKTKETYWRIAQALRINRTRSDGEPDAMDRKVINAQVSRYYHHAERLIRGVERGDFPVK